MRLAGTSFVRLCIACGNAPLLAQLAPLVVGVAGAFVKTERWWRMPPERFRIQPVLPQGDSVSPLG